MQTPFDYISYISQLIRQNKMAAELGFHPCTCSGITQIEGLLDRQRTHTALVCTTDTSEEYTEQRGGAWYRRRLFTTFIIHRYDPRNPQAYPPNLEHCPELFRPLHTRFIIDEARLHSQLCYLNTAHIRSRELGGGFLNAATGLYFMLTIDEPTDLQYNPEEWTTTPPQT